jgi:hypothetical protein
MFASSQGDAVQESFGFLRVLLRNYRKYLVFPSKHNEGSYGCWVPFRNTLKVNDTICVTFDQLIGTQMFDNFITKRLYGEW